MSRLSTINPVSSTGVASKIYSDIKKAAGLVPNCYTAIGTHSPAGLDILMTLDNVINNSSLKKYEIDAIKISVSAHAECRYCMAAHSYLGIFSGLSHETTSKIKNCESTSIEDLDILLTFVNALLKTKGTLQLQHLKKVLNAGYTEQNVLDIIMIMVSTNFLNLVNRVNDTSLDFPENG